MRSDRPDGLLGEWLEREHTVAAEATERVGVLAADQPERREARERMRGRVELREHIVADGVHIVHNEERRSGRVLDPV